ncbi:MAG: hypothetical protein NTW79_01995 [Candidatus Berkelbacteria bacterium]|nr:hypothetical protein [Candidatus Berkelbacteria bacterium]
MNPNFRSSWQILMDSINQLLNHQPQDECHKMILEDFGKAMSLMQNLQNLFFYFCVNLNARAEEEFGFDREAEIDLCQKVIEIEIRHRHAISDYVLHFVSARMILSDTVAMTIDEVVEWLEGILGREDLKAAGWRIVRRHPNDALEMADIYDNKAEQYRKEELHKSGLAFAEMLRAPND